MKLAQLLHNPGAGSEDHDLDALITTIEEHGFRCRYSSTKSDNWKEIENDVDFLIAAGGDGTVRKITKELLQRKKLEKTWPIAVLPLGTANNISKTLGVNDDVDEQAQVWKNGKILKYDVGLIHDFDKASYFLESVGYGLFPYLMRHMKKVKEEEDIKTPEEALERSLHMLVDFAHEYDPVSCQLQIDGVDYSGEFLLIEVMNSRSIGPNLFLAPNAKPDDGLLEVVLITGNDRQNLSDYVTGKLEGKDELPHFTSIKGEKIEICWTGNHLHVDDEAFSIERNLPIKIGLQKGLLEFLVP